MKQHQYNIYFLHGLESSGNGTKGQYFAKHYPHMKRPDFVGTLRNRLEQLDNLCADENDLIFVGSSFGGLMACCYAERNRQRVNRLILMAPALNFEGYTPPAQRLEVPVLLIIGRHDDVTPMDPVLGLAKNSFSHLTTWICEDDHMLHTSFYDVDWNKLLDPTVELSTLTPPVTIVKLA